MTISSFVNWKRWWNCFVTRPTQLANAPLSIKRATWTTTTPVVHNAVRVWAAQVAGARWTALPTASRVATTGSAAMVVAASVETTISSASERKIQRVHTTTAMRFANSSLLRETVQSDSLFEVRVPDPGPGVHVSLWSQISLSRVYYCRYHTETTIKYTTWKR